MQPVVPVQPETTLVHRLLSHPVLRLVVPLLMTGIALFVLHRMSTDINLADVKSDARAYPVHVLLLSFGAMCISYLALSLYDVIIIRGVTDVTLPAGVPMMTGVSSLAISNMLGFSWLTGGAIRYRIYAAFGVDIGAVARLIATSWAAFFVGLTVLMGGLMTLHPKGLSDVIPFSPRLETTLGVAIVCATAAYFVWTAKTRRSIGFGQFKMDLPLARDGLKMTAISIVDLAATALTLYVLMPPDLAQNFVFFFVIFVAAIGLGILSHSPGGLGVFDATIIAGLGATGRSDALAALVLYRVIYTILPFMMAVIGLAIAWVVANKTSASATSKTGVCGTCDAVGGRFIDLWQLAVRPWSSWVFARVFTIAVDRNLTSFGECERCFTDDCRPRAVSPDVPRLVCCDGFVGRWVYAVAFERVRLGRGADDGAVHWVALGVSQSLLPR
jgi:phosphatidylglycerol lysyltransferase